MGLEFRRHIGPLGFQSSESRSTLTSSPDQVYLEVFILILKTNFENEIQLFSKQSCKLSDLIKFNIPSGTEGCKNLKKLLSFVLIFSEKVKILRDFIYLFLKQF